MRRFSRFFSSIRKVSGLLCLSLALLPLCFCNLSAQEKQKPAPAGPLEGLKFVAVPEGCFEMGDTFGEGEKQELPVHTVCLPGFSLSATPLTVAHFRRFADSTGYRTEAEKGDGCTFFNSQGWGRVAGLSWRNPGFPQEDNHPAVCLSWNDSQAYLKWLNKETGQNYRLPTEAEWEYAARSGGKKERYAGFDDAKELWRYANFCDVRCNAAWKDGSQDDRHSFTAPVGSYRPNGLGLFDMTGNAWQWTGDFHSSTYYAESPKNNPQGPATGTGRVIRGGSWNRNYLGIRAAARLIHDPTERGSGLGFRLAVPTAGR